MRLVSVNVGMPREVRWGDETFLSGIVKEPVHGRVMLCETSIEGDGQADPNVHGGRSKAVCVYPVEHYSHWRKELGRDDLGFGWFGENFTVEGMPEDDVRVGDVFRVGGATVEVTGPRRPCRKLAARSGRPDFQEVFLSSGRTGYYLRVIAEGEVGADDPVDRIERGRKGATILEMTRSKRERR